MKILNTLRSMAIRMLGGKEADSTPAFSLLILTEKRPGAPMPEGLPELGGFCSGRGIPVLQTRVLTGNEARLGDTVLLAGYPTASQLASTCQSLRQLGRHVIIVLDALYRSEPMSDVLSELDEQWFQISTSTAVESLIKAHDHYTYAYAKSDATSTVAIFIDGGEQVLVIKRAHDPYQGCESLPGGFLKVLLENLAQCGAREVKEETGIIVWAEELKLVDVRSNPNRDYRGHVVDHGYMWLVPPERKAEVLSQLKAGDDAAEARFLPVADVLARQIAFDHRDLLVAALSALHK